MTRQLNIFVENKPGKLDAVTKILSDGNIQIIAFTIQSGGDFGVMRLLVSDPEKASLALSQKGLAVAMKEVLIVSIKDKAGNLHKLTGLLLQKNVNMVDTYGFVMEPGKQGVCCIEAENLPNVKEVLEKGGFKILTEAELHDL